MAYGNNPRKTFSKEISIDYAGAPMGKVKLECIAYLHTDGTLRTIDVNRALFNGDDVAGYVCAMQPDTWDEWTAAAEEHFREENEEPAPVEHDDEDCGEGYIQTNIV